LAALYHTAIFMPLPPDSVREGIIFGLPSAAIVRPFIGLDRYCYHHIWTPWTVGGGGAGPVSWVGGPL